MDNGVEMIYIGIVCMTLVFFSGCLGSNPETPVTPGPAADTNQTSHEVSASSIAEKAVVDANNKFALKLFSSLIKDPQYANHTVFFSPFSISSALAVTYEGARGTTAEEIQSVFLFPDNNSVRRSGFRQLFKESNLGNSRYIMKTANALWAEKTYPFLPGYLDVAQKYYDANATNLDFKNQPENSRVTINSWVEDRTNTKIKDLIPRGSIDSSTRLVITNAIYFKGIWVKQFDKNETKDDIFFVEPGKSVHVQMMKRTDENAVFRYTETDDMQVLEMPYITDNQRQLSMLVLLPRNNNLINGEESLNAEKLSELRKALVSQRVNVTFPKFNLDTKYNLPETLKLMGMKYAFTNQADFSGMDGTNNLFIGDVIHQAFIDVNEEGAEAAAATGVVIKLTALHNTPVQTFRADHPFIFLIQDNQSENILFIGLVTNPTS